MTEPTKRKWTGGEWRFDPCYAIYAYPEGDVLLICNIETIDAGEAQANAYLIAAVPKLFEAADKMLNHYLQLVYSGDAGDWNPEHEQEVIVLRAALSAALGEGE